MKKGSSESREVEKEAALLLGSTTSASTIGSSGSELVSLKQCLGFESCEWRKSMLIELYPLRGRSGSTGLVVAQLGFRIPGGTPKTLPLLQINLYSSPVVKNLHEETLSLRQVIHKLEQEIELPIDEGNALHQELIYCLKEELNTPNEKSRSLEEQVEKAVLLAKLVENSGLSAKQISCLENTNPKQQVEMKALEDQLNVLHLWLYDEFGILKVDARHGVRNWPSGSWIGNGLKRGKKMVCKQKNGPKASDLGATKDWLVGRTVEQSSK
ncbi:hypothetical protein CRG98_000178 [Punica granatum]|uniref:Uncharacterized protein n=1 Tax=Punica granatum TaxID=22663 RepID=A0A2I0LFI0_PUNGR|nr:hypothetical protein CRG98_000178 [Punica granatum]